MLFAPQFKINKQKLCSERIQIYVLGCLHGCFMHKLFGVFLVWLFTSWFGWKTASGLTALSTYMTWSHKS